MKRQSSYIVTLFILTALIMVTTGFQLISFDILKSHETSLIQKTVQLTAFTATPAKEKVDLGVFPAWSKFEVTYESNQAVGVRMGDSRINMYPTSIGRTNQVNTFSFTSIANKPISLYLIYEPFQANNGGGSGSIITATVYLNITVHKASEYSTNMIIISLITFLSFLFIKRRNGYNWREEEVKELSNILQLDAKRTYRMNNTWCDTCGRRYYGASDELSSTRNCSFTCNLINLKPILYTITILTTVISWINHWFLIPAIILFSIVLYIAESDTHTYRYKMYPKRKKELEEESKERIKVINAIPTKYIEELDEEFLVCCYQSARLDELYCECGRIVPGKLRKYLNLEHLT